MKDTQLMEEFARYIEGRKRYLQANDITESRCGDKPTASELMVLVYKRLGTLERKIARMESEPLRRLKRGHK